MHRHVISAAETLPIVVTNCVIHVRMTVFFVVVGIRSTMMIEVPSRGLDAIVKAPPLHVAKLGRWRVPAPLVMIIARSLRSSRVGPRWGRTH